MTMDLARDPPESRLEDERCVMLYDPSAAGNFAASWFDPNHWQAEGALRGKATGRGSTLFFASGGQEFALRHYRRGGLIAQLCEDLYLNLGESSSRPFQEFRVTQRLQCLGLPVARVVAARYVARGLGCTGDLITQRLLHSRTLAECLHDTGVTSLVTSDWRAVGTTIARFHAVGLDHADLNAHNLLQDANGDWHLIDFDRARFRPRGLWCDANLVRLRRSLLKVCDLKKITLDEAWWAAVLAGYRHALRAAA